MNISTIADWIQIFMFVISFGAFIIASISKRSSKWLKSVFYECLQDFLGKHGKNGDKT